MLIDITQELFSCNVFPGDPKPEMTQLQSIEKGDICNLTGLSMCAHNGTHADAPNHFIKEGKTIDQLGLEPFVGDCFVARKDGDVLAEDAGEILRRAKEAGASQRILIAGKATVTEEAARVFADAGILLLGNESQTVGPEEAPMTVHLILLGSECVLLEGIVLDGVKEGRYYLSAAPLNLGGCEGSPCRAYLIDSKGSDSMEKRMIDTTLIDRLSSGMKQILDAETEAGNVILETYQGGFSKVTDEHIFVFLKYPFKNQYDIPGVVFREINDPHYWKAEYDDDLNHQTIACNYGK